MSRVLCRLLANEDILDIWCFIAEDNPSAENRWVDRLDETLVLLAAHPLMGRMRNELEVGIRSFAHASHVIFYLPLADGIKVVRVLHAARDIPAAFE